MFKRVTVKISQFLHGATQILSLCQPLLIADLVMLEGEYDK